MALKYLLDTVILIDHLNGIAAATRWLQKTRAPEMAISVITRAEVLTGSDASHVAHMDILALLDRFTCVEIDARVADRAAALRRAHRWKLPDAFQAAIAEHLGVRLVTRNTRDFPSKKFPFVLVPYEVG